MCVCVLLECLNTVPSGLPHFVHQLVHFVTMSTFFLKRLGSLKLFARGMTSQRSRNVSEDNNSIHDTAVNYFASLLRGPIYFMLLWLYISLKIVLPEVSNSHRGGRPPLPPPLLLTQIRNNGGGGGGGGATSFGEKVGDGGGSTAATSFLWSHF